MIVQVKQKVLIIPELEKRIFWLLLTAAVTLGALYLYFLSQIVINVVLRKDGEEQIISRQTEITGLEAEYVKLSSAVTMDLAYALGFHDATNQMIFAYRQKPTLSLRDR